MISLNDPMDVQVRGIAVVLATFALLPLLFLHKAAPMEESA